MACGIHGPTIRNRSWPVSFLIELDLRVRLNSYRIPDSRNGLPSSSTLKLGSCVRYSRESVYFYYTS